MIVVNLLLLLACTNLASMLLARAVSRQHEMALRISLGASPFRLIRPVLSETLLFSVLGTVLTFLYQRDHRCKRLPILWNRIRLRHAPYNDDR
jgi:ABC-type antimicrobial peptide transport system permease subunit